jgi:hypothetical protein
MAAEKSRRIISGSGEQRFRDLDREYISAGRPAMQKYSPVYATSSTTIRPVIGSDYWEHDVVDFDSFWAFTFFATQDRARCRNLELLSPSKG